MTHEAWRRTPPAPTAGPRSPPPPPLIRYAERVPAGAPSVRLALATGGPPRSGGPPLAAHGAAAVGGVWRRQRMVARGAWLGALALCACVWVPRAGEGSAAAGAGVEWRAPLHSGEHQAAAATSHSRQLQLSGVWGGAAPFYSVPHGSVVVCLGASRAGHRLPQWTGGAGWGGGPLTSRGVGHPPHVVRGTLLKVRLHAVGQPSRVEVRPATTPSMSKPV